MPIKVIEGSLNYCLENKAFFLFVLFLLFILKLIPIYTNGYVETFASVIICVIIMGYGLQVTEDIIRGGTRLPKIMPKKVILFGIKGLLINIFYAFIQFFFLHFVSLNINFPDFELHSILMEYHETLNIFYSHDIIAFILFMISGFVISYVAVFFMELSLARLADGGQLRKSFNFPRIKHAIDIIGWKNYVIGYTKIILVVIVFSHISNFFNTYGVFGFIVSVLTYFFVFVVEYRGIGQVYKVYIDNKEN